MTLQSIGFCFWDWCFQLAWQLLYSGHGGSFCYKSSGVSLELWCPPTAPCSQLSCNRFSVQHIWESLLVTVQAVDVVIVRTLQHYPPNKVFQVCDAPGRTRFRPALVIGLIQYSIDYLQDIRQHLLIELWVWVILIRLFICIIPFRVDIWVMLYLGSSEDWVWPLALGLLALSFARYASNFSMRSSSCIILSW